MYHWNSGLIKCGYDFVEIINRTPEGKQSTLGATKLNHEHLLQREHLLQHELQLQLKILSAQGVM